MFSVKKKYTGFSTVFRQWRAEGTHCKFLHGYGLYFYLHFEGELDQKNWVFDFGGMKRAKHDIDDRNPQDWFKYMFDHTTIIAQDDPELHVFRALEDKGLIKLRVIPHVGAERFAEFIHSKVSNFLLKETEGKVKLTKVEIYEHDRNQAAYSVK